MKEAYSGKLLESELLGEIIHQPHEHLEYQTYNESIKWVKGHQPGDPADPVAPFSNDLHATMAEELCPEKYDRLKFYTSVGSSLDRFHGVDAFFEYLDKNKKLHRVTIDLTTNPQKDEYKADYIMQIDEDYLDKENNQELYNSMVDSQSREITAIFRMLEGE